jgi:predicted enzyme related to lactoylglutathione lyase
MFLGLRTTIYRVADINAAKAWYEKSFGCKPYFDQPYYVGFNIGGYELGLHPIEDKTPQPGNNVLAYWGVTDIYKVFEHLRSCGATPNEEVQEVGEGIKVASLTDPFGNVIGIIENPHFKIS